MREKNQNFLTRYNWENILTLLYSIITFYKYAIVENPDILCLTLNALLDVLLGYMIYEVIKEIRRNTKKELKESSSTANK